MFKSAHIIVHTDAHNTNQITVIESLDFIIFFN